MSLKLSFSVFLCLNISLMRFSVRGHNIALRSDNFVESFYGIKIPVNITDINLSRHEQVSLTRLRLIKFTVSLRVNFLH